ncbi:Putative ABC transporter, permease protein [Croceitalea dokdonensis DOKDO 023]|uniref:Putative ABC transporter, permease protein n=1 Tax=Croceitalea dokdonensis DOKDO 023 TaxID=1300341 RepID=A0A0P7API2_9FLAO|nr:ABC transporter permease [Croceitalea dokdonensis]KPM30838.1 Putative ABC transporter, permease protein [Croceitalea dokdonensis DOKDO 023]
MFKNYLKIAWRNLMKKKAFSLVNIFGLATGLAACMLLILYVLDETSYDSHHAEVEQIYRVATQVEDKKWAATPAPLAQGLKTDFPEVETVTRILNFPNTDNLLLENTEKSRKFYVNKGYYADSTFFELFTYESKYGNLSKALASPNTVVLSETIATKLFGSENPLNKIISVEIPFGKLDYTVKAVFKDTGTKSHLSPNLLLSMQNGDIGQWVMSQNSWANNNLFHTYLKLQKGSSTANFQSKLPAFFERYAGEELSAYSIKKTLFLQPLQDIYLKSDIGNEIAPNGNMTYLYIFSAIAFFLLLIACVNFMNLSTARSEKRAKEVGVRKVMGANKDSLVYQFLGESMLLSLLALLLSIVIVAAVLPAFNAFVQKSLSLFLYPKATLWIMVITAMTGVLSGLYPAFYLSSFKPVTVLKGRIKNNLSATILRKGLVVFQFAVSVSLILVSVVIWKQMDFIQNKDLGFKKEQQLVIPFRSENTVKNYTALKNETLKNSNIVTATVGSTYPGFELVSDMSFYAEGKTKEENVYMKFAQVDHDYIETLEYNLLQGRDFSQGQDTDIESIIINETAAKNFGYDIDKAVGRQITYEFGEESNSLTIIGVVKDFNHQSLHETISPYGIVKLDQSQPSYFIANINGDLDEALAHIEGVWNTINPKVPFEYSFIGDDFDKNYATEKKTSTIVFIFMFIAIFIACIGLFGLASFSAEQRKKEVGIRRVLGAKISEITLMQLKDFLVLVIIAILVASPLAYYFGETWLQNFSYQISISWSLFAITTCATLLIALVTISAQVIKSATANPVKSLRTE